MAKARLFKSLFGNLQMTRYLVVVMAVATWSIASPSVSADACKPDVSGRDSITKKQVDMWRQVLSSSGFLSAALMDNDVTFTAFVQRGGDKNYIMVVFQKVEENLGRAAFESHYHATKGDQIIFGFRSGDPVSLVATGASNRAQADMFGKLNMTAEWVVEIPDNEMATLRDALATRQVDAIRLTIANGQIDRPVPDKNGKNLMEKFACFYQTLDKRGVVLAGGSSSEIQATHVAPVSNDAHVSTVSRPAGPPQDYAASAPGTYVRKNSTDSFDLGADGVCSGHHDGQTIECTYKVLGDVITLTSPRLRAPVTGHISGSTLTFADGNVYDKQSAATPKGATRLTVDQIIQMVGAKLPDDIIITTIQNSDSKFNLSSEALIKLKTAGVSDAVIRVMTR